MAREVDDRFSARVSTPHATWPKARVVLDGAWVHVIAADGHGAPRIVAQAETTAVHDVAGRLLVDVATPGGTERWEAAGPCGCASPAKRWATSALVALIDTDAGVAPEG